MNDAAIRRKILADTRKKVRQFGQTVIFVGGDDHGSPPFHYTVGRGTRGLPELLIVAPLAPAVGMSLLNHLDHLMPKTLPSGSLVDLGGKYPVMLLDADDRAQDDYTGIANVFHGEKPYRVQQVLLCDPAGRFPPDCAAPYDRQPILGDAGTPTRGIVRQ